MVGHVGLLPQTAEASSSGGYRRHGVNSAAALQVLRDAAAVEAAGACAIVVEMVPDEVSSIMTGHVAVPTIGIGAGPGTDGQVLVLHDMLGMLPGAPPTFSQRYAGVFQEMRRGIARYVRGVKDRSFPGQRQRSPLRPKARKALDAALHDGRVSRAMAEGRGAGISQRPWEPWMAGQSDGVSEESST